jgi:hypothetical protein
MKVNRSLSSTAQSVGRGCSARGPTATQLGRSSGRLCEVGSNACLASGLRRSLLPVGVSLSSAFNLSSCSFFTIVLGMAYNDPYASSTRIEEHYNPYAPQQYATQPYDTAGGAGGYGGYQDEPFAPPGGSSKTFQSAGAPAAGQQPSDVAEKAAVKGFRYDHQENLWTKARASWPDALACLLTDSVCREDAVVVSVASFAVDSWASYSSSSPSCLRLLW